MICCKGRECDRRTGKWDAEPDDACETHDLCADNEQLRAALRLAKPFIDTMAGWGARGSYKARDAIDHALGEKE